MSWFGIPVHLEIHNQNCTNEVRGTLCVCAQACMAAKLNCLCAWTYWKAMTYKTEHRRWECLLVSCMCIFLWDFCAFIRLYTSFFTVTLNWSNHGVCSERVRNKMVQARNFLPQSTYMISSLIANACLFFLFSHRGVWRKLVSMMSSSWSHRYYTVCNCGYELSNTSFSSLHSLILVCTILGDCFLT